MSNPAGNHEHRMAEGWRPSTKELLLMLRDTSDVAVPSLYVHPLALEGQPWRLP